jgi:hypothetical protein
VFLAATVAGYEYQALYDQVVAELAKTEPIIAKLQAFDGSAAAIQQVRHQCFRRTRDISLRAATLLLRSRESQQHINCHMHVSCVPRLYQNRAKKQKTPPSPKFARESLSFKNSINTPKY